MLAIFYYKESMNDTMSIIINNNKPNRLEHKNGHAFLYRDDVLIGINMFDVSKHINLPEGFLEANDQVVNWVKKVSGVDLNTYNSPKFVVGRIDSATKIPNTHLTHCQVFNGYNTTSVVCGASNVEVGLKVVLANAGAALPSGKIIYPSKLHGIESHGMLCSKFELFGTQDGSSGILVLGDEYKIGTEFKQMYKNFKGK